jgi:ribonuclease D
MDAALRMPTEDFPARRPPRKPKSYKGKPDEKVMKKLAAERDIIAAELQLTPSLLAPKATLQSLSAEKPLTEKDLEACSPLMHWQAGLLAKRFLPILRNARENAGEEE